MSRTIEVCLGEAGTAVGMLHYDRSGTRESSAFQYIPEWLRSAERFAIDPTLPLVRGPQFRKAGAEGSVFPGAIADSEPDGWGRRVVLRDHAKRRAAGNREPLPSPLSPLDFLLAVDDFSRVGALRFREGGGPFERPAPAEGRRAPPLLELRDILAASRAVELDTATVEDLAFLRGRGTSLGGLRPKCTIVDEDGHLAIGKFPSVGDMGPVTAGEVLALHLATVAGVHAARARLIVSDEHKIALIRRFDRRGSARLAYLSAASLLGVDSHDSLDHSYTEIVDAIRQHGANARRDITELWRRMAFSILITNVDDHLRNHGFLHAGSGLWDLAPAFDVNPFPGRARELKTWISEDAGPAATISGLMSVVPYFGLTLPDARRILGEVEAAVATWRTVGQALGMTASELESLEEAFEHPERLAARREVARTAAGG